MWPVAASDGWHAPSMARKPPKVSLGSNLPLLRLLRSWRVWLGTLGNFSYWVCFSVFLPCLPSLEARWGPGHGPCHQGAWEGPLWCGHGQGRNHFSGTAWQISGPISMATEWQRLNVWFCFGLWWPLITGSSVSLCSSLERSLFICWLGLFTPPPNPLLFGF